MNWSNSETSIYNQALKNVEKTNKQLASMTVKIQKEVISKINQFYLSVDPTWTDAYKTKRVEEIIKQSDRYLSLLSKYFITTLTAGYVLNYISTFSGYGKIITPLAGESIKIISEKEILKNLYRTIGDFNFLKHEKEVAETLRSKLQDMVKSAVDRGINPKKLEKELAEEFGKHILRHQATARTELLTAYSIAQEESISQAEGQGIRFRFKWKGNDQMIKVGNKMVHRERETHRKLNDTYAVYDKKDDKYYFHASGCKGTGPRLFSGEKAAGENINCRCRKLCIPVTD